MPREGEREEWSMASWRRPAHSLYADVIVVAVLVHCSLSLSLSVSRFRCVDALGNPRDPLYSDCVICVSLSHFTGLTFSFWHRITWNSISFSRWPPPPNRPSRLRRWPRHRVGNPCCELLFLVSHGSQAFALVFSLWFASKALFMSLIHGLFLFVFY